MKTPIDRFPHAQDPRSQPITPNLPDGPYAYVRDANGVVLCVPDGPHVHPTILGGGLPAMYAGDLTIKDGKVFDLTNLSGTFQFDDEAGLCDVAAQLRLQGMLVEPGGVRFFPPDGSRPVILE